MLKGLIIATVDIVYVERVKFVPGKSALAGKA
jgi:hypothetical protein